MAKTRATTERAKTEKKEKLLYAAMTLLEEGRFPLPSVSQIIAEAAEAKGTFYLYFGSKEEVFLTAMVVAFDQFKVQLIQRLHDRARPTAYLLATEFLKFANEEPKIMFIAHITPLVLENNVSDGFIVQLKKGLLGITNEIADMIHDRDGMPAQQARENFLISYNLFLGMRQHSVPPKNVEQLMEANGLSALRYDFEKKFVEILDKIWS